MKKENLNKIEKRYFIKICIWRHFCNEFQPLKKDIKRINKIMIKMICLKRSCNLRTRKDG